MKKDFIFIKGTLRDTIVSTENEYCAEEYINTPFFNAIEIKQMLQRKIDSEIIVFKKINGRWFASIEDANYAQIEIIDVEPITDKVLWYALANNKEQLRHLQFIIKQDPRRSGVYNIARKAAGNKLAA